MKKKNQINTYKSTLKQRMVLGPGCPHGGNASKLSDIVVWRKAAIYGF